MPCPIKSFSGITIPSGTHLMTFISIEEKQDKKSIFKTEGGKKVYVGKSDTEMEDILSLKFGLLTDEGDAYATFKCYPSNGPNSKLVKLLKSIAPLTFNESVREDPEKMWKFIQTLTGIEYLVLIDSSPNAQGKQYNNIKGVLAAPAAKPLPKIATPIKHAASTVAPGVPPQDLTGDEPPAFDDDDIPF